MKRILGVLLLSTAAAAQQYVISTYAGGAPPRTPEPAIAGPIGAPISVTTDDAGNAYFASLGLNCVFKLQANGGLTRVAGNGMWGYSGDGGPATSAQLRFSAGSTNSAGLAVDSAGNLFIADTGNHRIRRVSPDGIITTVAGIGTPGFGGDSGPATGAQLNYPWAVAVDGAGNLFIVDALNFRIRKVAVSGIITTVAGGGTLTAASGDGGLATNAQLSAWDVAVDGAGNLFIVDSFSHGIHVASGLSTSIRKISPSGIITTVAQAPVMAWGVSVDGAGNLFYADAFGSIRKISADGRITTVAGKGTFGFSGDGGPATGAQLNYPWDVAVDAAGNLFIADRLNYRIRKVTTTGTIATVAGDGTGGGFEWGNGGVATDGGSATSSQLSNPQGVAVDGAGNVFIADYGNNRIRRVSPSGIITTVAGNGTQGFSGDGGPAANAQLTGPLAVTADGGGNLFFIDSGNNRVRKISSTGIITTVAGNGAFGFFGDGGPATGTVLSGFNCNRACGGLAVDGAGNLFIADGESRVRKVSASGIITTVAGNGVAGFSGDGGPATEANLYSTVGVAVDDAGNLFIADGLRIRKVSPSGIITTVAGSGIFDGPSTDGEAAIKARLSYAYALVVDDAGNLLIAEPGESFVYGDPGSQPADHRIRRVSPGGIITTVAGDGVGGYSGDGGPASSARLNGPMALSVDRSGAMYVADSGNHVVRILRPTSKSVVLGAVVDAASQRTDLVAPGKIVVIYGAGLGPSELIENPPGDGQVSTEIDATKVAFNGVAAPILYASATQIAAIAPYALTGSTVEVTVAYQGEVSNAFTLPVAMAAPSLFTLNQAGWGQAAAINADGTTNTAANPIKIGGYISLYATGEGQTAPAGLDGRVAGSTQVRPARPVSVTIGGIRASLQYAGSAPGQVAGVMQVNAQIPDGVQPGGYVPVILQVGDKSSNPSVWIAVSPN